MQLPPAPELECASLNEEVFRLNFQKVHQQCSVRLALDYPHTWDTAHAQHEDIIQMYDGNKAHTMRKLVTYNQYGKFQVRNGKLLNLERMPTPA